VWPTWVRFLAPRSWACGYRLHSKCSKCPLRLLTCLVVPTLLPHPAVTEGETRVTSSAREDKGGHGPRCIRPHRGVAQADVCGEAARRARASEGRGLRSRRRLDRVEVAVVEVSFSAERPQRTVGRDCCRSCLEFARAALSCWAADCGRDRRDNMCGSLRPYSFIKQDFQQSSLARHYDNRGQSRYGYSQPTK